VEAGMGEGLPAGSVTPLSNNATICSYPRFNANNTMPLEIARPGHDGLSPKTTLAVRFRPWNILIAAGTYTDDINTAFRTLALAAIGLLLGLGALGVTGSLLIGRGIVRPLDRLGRRMQALAQGDGAEPIPGLGRTRSVR
ncbi:hypothetical protein OMR07_30410, partial [Methylobacterium organophilum]|nr:hypothetical protein [Methylobacterium organophilum]